MIKKVFIFVFFLLTVFNGFSQTVLSPGDIAIIGFNSDNPDEFSFVALTTLTNTTVIKFTDKGWLNTGSFRSLEGELTWTANAVVNCGDEVFIDATNETANTGSVSATGGFSLSASGDQITAFQGTLASPTNIYAINFEGAGIWQADAIDANTSALPTGLTNGTSAVALNENDNGKYNCSVTVVQASILAAIGNNTNWTMSSSRVTLPVACGFICSACILASEPTANSSTLTFSTIDCLSMTLNWTSGNGSNRIVVASTSPITGSPTDQIGYIANISFGNGATIAVGEFVIYNGSGTSVSVTGLNQSTTYYFAIFEYNGTLANCEENYLTSGIVSGNETTITCVCPEIKEILIDACGTSEGTNEFFTFQNGNSNLLIDSLTATFPLGGSYCNSGCGAQTWVTNPTYVSALNTTATCPGLFVEADPIPANAEVIVFTGAAPVYSFDFTGLCGTGPYYVVFANNTTGTGRFANYSSTCSIRTLNVDFGNSCTDAVSYDRCLLSNNDGDYITYNPAGVATYLNDGCTPLKVLPITLIYFKGSSTKNNRNLIEWSTLSEINNDYFTIEKATKALNFKEIGTINGTGNSNSVIQYQFIDDAATNPTVYYRLKQTDFDGNYAYSEIIVLNNNLLELTIYNLNNTLYLFSETTTINGLLNITDVSGRVVYSKNITENQQINISNLKSGMYLVKYRDSNHIIVKKMKF